MFNPRHFLRMAKWTRRPPSDKQVKLFALVVLICLILLGVERFIGWPDWLMVNHSPKGRF